MAVNASLSLPYQALSAAFVTSLWEAGPTGTAFSMAARTAARLSGRSLATRSVMAAHMPQPMSTPTAAGTIAPLVGITLPTVAPMPQCTSGIAATHLWMNGSRATFKSCFFASSCSSTPLVQALTGTPLSLLMRLYRFSDIELLLTQDTRLHLVR